MPDTIDTVMPASPDAAQAPAPAAAPAPPSVWARWRPSVLTGVVTWVTGIAIYYVVTAAAWLPLQDLEAKAGAAPGTLHELLGAWNRWDTTWYLIVADSGYTADTRATAFFPGYPMAVRAADAVVPGGSYEAGLAVSALACLAALILLHRLATELTGAEDARRATFYLLAFPTGFYLVAAYNESLFIALALASLYCMRQGRWWAAGLLAGCASATRMAGVMLGAAFVVEYLRQSGFALRWSGSPHLRLPRLNWGVLGIVLVPGGLLAYMYYLQRTFGDPLHFLESQKSWFHDGFTPPWQVVADVFDLIARSGPLYHPDTIRNIANLGTALAVLLLLVLALVGPWRLGAKAAYLVVFAAIVMLMPLSNPIHSYYPLSSVWRFALECSVAFLVLARMGRRPGFDRAYTGIALALQGVMIVTFVQNNFVA
ncbi:mannosyltransferase family protein [Catellatospora sp. KI3]|uniref:mannosyltransferase family protein n=1 Tax=Catellatospora sp. KI3 TaxID=3041620 RepID=UPI002482839A|nr:mannosyltransferase family protein [Catellatospora sp. KI3]MDI1465996.1 mannosyltransferase family protein [Catellatospora sp. KI3]